ncbi:MAG: PD-(D/E)XK nuclease family protein [Phormidesmis sp.]
MLPLSQSHLTLLETCPRKYQYIFFDALSTPATYDPQITTQWGSQFHLLMQQRALNLPVELLADANVEMAESMAALATAAPDVFAHLPISPSAERSSVAGTEDADAARPVSQNQLSPDEFSQSEHQRTLAFGDYLLTVVYDLVVLSAEQGQIFDWKTHLRPPREDWLREDWQTRLYLYVLCETTDLLPEQLSMTYWFVRLGAMTDAQPSFYRFDYSIGQHRHTQQDLQRLTMQLAQMRDRADFPKVSIDKGRCDRCLFNVRCDRLSPSDSLLSDPSRLLREARQITADTVEEIPL